MVPAAMLKVFEPLSGFDDDERAYWESYRNRDDAIPPKSFLLDRESGLDGDLATLVAQHEHGEIIERKGAAYVCPHRTKLRLLAAVLEFRRAIPAEVVRAFMPEDEVERAAEEIESIRNAHPAWRNHIQQSAWEVPLHWFAAFDDAERQRVVSADGSIGLRYEAWTRAAHERVARALEIVRANLPNPRVIAPLAGLARWLEEFSDAGLLVLDYADVARILPPDVLEEDRTCRDIWASIRALSEGDGDRATAHYIAAAERWSAVRRPEAWN